MGEPRYTNITEIKKANTAAGRFWFSPKTIAFFDVKVESRVFDGGTSGGYPQGSRVWVESTRNCDDTGREYKIARFDVGSADIVWVSIDHAAIRFGSRAEAETFLTTNLI